MCVCMCSQGTRTETLYSHLVTGELDDYRPFLLPEDEEDEEITRKGERDVCSVNDKNAVGPSVLCMQSTVCV